MNIFEKASKLRLRFDSGRGMIATEDLWFMDLEELDELAVELAQGLDDSRTSFIVNKRPAGTKNHLRLELAKRVIEVRLAAATAAEEKVVRDQKKARILAILDKKQDDELTEASAEELTQMLAEL